jgi:hypothetical protein
MPPRAMRLSRLPHLLLHSVRLRRSYGATRKTGRVVLSSAACCWTHAGLEGGWSPASPAAALALTGADSTTHPVRRSKDCIPFRFRPRHLSGIRAALTSGAVQCPSGTHARNGIPALRLRFGRSCARKAKSLAFRLAEPNRFSPLGYSLPGLTVTLPARRRRRSHPTSKRLEKFSRWTRPGKYGEAWSAGLSFYEEKCRNRVSG